MNRISSKAPRALGLVRMGRLDETAVHVVAANLQTVLDIPVDILDAMDLPSDSLLNRRQQHDAGLILKHLSQQAFLDRYLKLVALTDADISIPILTYVFGEAEVGGRVALVSGFRLRQREGGMLVPLDTYYERLAKVALHEVAHTLSLYHCEDSSCLMHFCPKPADLDLVQILFCRRCRFMIRQSIREIRKDAALLESVRVRPF